MSSAVFWDLMARWSLPPDEALELIGYQGQAKPGKRPRFRLSPQQSGLLASLLEIEDALKAAQRDPSWLRTRSPRLRRRAPLDWLRDGDAASVLRALAKDALQASVEQSS